MHAVTFHAVDTQMKSMHKQGVGERSEPYSLFNIINFIMKLQKQGVQKHSSIYIIVIINYCERKRKEK